MKTSHRWTQLDGKRAVAVAAALILILLLGLGMLNILAPQAAERLIAGPTPTPAPTPTPGPPTAAIIDQTGLSFPTPDFLAEARTILEDAGYVVDHVPPERITVDFLRNLPTYGYDLILFQTHATSEAVTQSGEQTDAPPGPFLFTTEPYQEQKHVRLQLEDQVRASRMFHQDSPTLFAVGPKFVRKTMRGYFPSTVIIIGGCQSLAADDLAQAFLERGAASVVGWDEMVSLSHSNQAVLNLLQSMLLQGLTVEDAVAETMTTLGPDTTTGSSLALLTNGH